MLNSDIFTTSNFQLIEPEAIKGSVIIISLKHGLKLGIFYDSLAGPIILFFGMCNLQLKAKKTVFCFF